jgi:hypothetical protein
MEGMKETKKETELGRDLNNPCMAGGEGIRLRACFPMEGEQLSSSLS